MPHVVVGQRIRVAPSASDGVSRRALVLALDGDTDVEVEYEGSGGEEAVIPLSRCTALLAFEEEDGPADESPTSRAERLKGEGNALFKLRDASAALGRYVAALKTLQADAPLSAGARCLLKPDSGASALRSVLLLSHANAPMP